MKGFFLKNRRSLDITLIIFSIISFFVIVKPCYADPIDKAVTFILGWIAQMVVYVCSKILLITIWGVVKIANYSEFTTNTEIINAWVVIRDFCNMFFILILLVIAFATILRIESYNMKKWLPKLLIMSVLINFSRTICGVFIDFSQLVMLTFVSAFADGGGNFVEYLQVKDYLAMARKQGSWFGDDSVNLSNTVAAIMIAVIFMIVATVAMLAILAIFVMRVIMLWIYVVLSPLAFLLSSFPQGASYASKYWGEFTRYLINGPVLAFFIWLSLITISQLSLGGDDILNVGDSAILEPASFMSFILAIGFLVGGLMISQQIGGTGASWGASTVKGMANKGVSFAKGAVKRTGRAAADLGIGVVNQQPVRNVLGAIGGSRVPIANTLATKAFVGLGERQRSIEEKAQRYVKNINDPRILSRFVNRRGNITPWRAAVNEAATVKMPTAIGRRIYQPGQAYTHAQTTRIQARVNQMSPEEIRSKSLAEVREIGRAGVVLSGEAEGTIRRDRARVGAFNDANPNQVHRWNQHDQDMPDYGTQYNTTDVETQARLRRQMSPLRDNRYNYQKVEEENLTEEEGERGIGNLQIGDFSREKAETFAVDFDRLDVKNMKEKGDEYKDIRGVNTNNSEEIAAISKRMVDILDSEIKKLESKDNPATGDKDRVKNLERAKARFSEPEKLEKLNLVNSGALGMTSLRKIKETMIHEETHGYGIDDEDKTDHIAKSMEHGHSRKSREKIAKSYLQDEEDSLEGQVELEQKFFGPSESSETIKPIDPEAKNIINQIVQAPPSTNPTDLTYFFKTLTKQFTVFNDRMGEYVKKISVQSKSKNEAVSPMEIKIIKNELQGYLDKEKI